MKCRRMMFPANIWAKYLWKPLSEWVQARFGKPSGKLNDLRSSVLKCKA